MKVHPDTVCRRFSLIIDSVKVPHTGGVIGMTSCPGKQDDFFFEPLELRLRADIETMRTWGASVVVSLIDEQEMKILKIDNLFEKLCEQGIRWMHLPIANKSLPGPEFEKLWAAAGEELRRILNEGGRIILHCKEGVGRTGLIAARLMIEMGVDTMDAVRLIRRARSGALETLTHERYCTALKTS